LKKHKTYTQNLIVNRFLELDALRGIAVFLVLLSHYTWAYDYHFQSLSEHSFHFSHGEFGVQVFFMISGFVIFMTIEKTQSIKDFIISRFSRLYPHLLDMFINYCFSNKTISNPYIRKLQYKTNTTKLNDGSRIFKNNPY
jgi:peptidoglycan/LPS O-acetylase OafA/YrhL